MSERMEKQTNKKAKKQAKQILNHADFHPFSPDIKMHILITDLYTFLMELVRRICLNIQTSYPQ